MRYILTAFVFVFLISTANADENLNPAFETLVSQQATTNDHMKIASSMKGLHERRNRKALKNKIGVDPVRTPWCGAFVKTVLKKSGEDVSRVTLRAKSFVNVGRKIDRKQVQKGDIVIFHRGKNGGHVGFVTRVEGGYVYVLGGNQKNQVNVSRYRVNKIWKARRI